MKTATVIDCGNCGPDHRAICALVEGRLGGRVVQTHGAADTLEKLRTEPVDLVLVNRKLDQDYSDGMEVIRQIRAESAWEHIPVMLVSNYPEHQAAAVEIGAVAGFGKLALSDPRTTELLKKYLG